MATVENSSETDAQMQEQHQKDVIVTAYARDEYDTKREFVSDVFDEVSIVDLEEKEIIENRSTRLEIEMEKEISEHYTCEISQTINATFDDQRETLKEAIDEDALPPWATFVDEVTSTEEYVNSPKKALKAPLRGLFDTDTLADLDFEYKTGMWCGSWTREIDDKSIDADPDDTISQYVRVQVPSIEKERILVHQSERTRDNRFETDEERWSVQVKIRMEASSDDELETISQRLVTPVYDMLATLQGIEKVRLTDCEKKVRTSGECYNI